MIYKGEQSIGYIHKDGHDITKAYKGSQQIWPSETPVHQNWCEWEGGGGCSFYYVYNDTPYMNNYWISSSPISKTEFPLPTYKVVSYGLFSEATKITYMDDTYFSMAKDRGYGFRINAPYITEFPLVNVSCFTNFEYAFSGCTSLLSIPALDFSNGTQFGLAFKDCSALTGFSGTVDFSNGEDLTNAFYNCTSLTHIILTGRLRSNFDISYSPLSTASIVSILTAANNFENDYTVTFMPGSTIQDDAQGTYQALLDSCISKGWTIRNLTIIPA